MPPSTALLFARDPGAANYIAPVARHLDLRGWDVHLFAEANAKEVLARADVPHQPRPSVAEPTLEELKPSVVVAGTDQQPASWAFELTAEANASHIPTVGIVDAYMMADARFRGTTNDPLAHAPDHLIVPDAGTARAYSALGFPAEAIHVCGHPHYDEVRTRGESLADRDRQRLRERLLPEQPSTRPVVTFLAEPSPSEGPFRMRRSPAYSLEGWGDRDDRTAIVLETYLDGLSSLDSQPATVLRLHPKNDRMEFSRYEDHLQGISEDDPVLPLLHASDVVVGMTSTALVEAAILGCRTLSILPREEESAWCPAVRQGYTPCVTQPSQVQEALSRVLHQDPPKEGFTAHAEHSVVRALDTLEEIVEDSG
jgi:hypothetical protein